MEDVPMTYADILAAKDKIDRLLAEQAETVRIFQMACEIFTSQARQMNALIGPIRARLDMAAKGDFSLPNEPIN
jgi:S-methylmethionine-dependent homocysteine/selenocysteine methylase